MFEQNKNRNNSPHEIDFITNVHCVFSFLFRLYTNRLQYYFPYLLAKMKNKREPASAACMHYTIANVYLCSTVRLCIQSLGVACNIIYEYSHTRPYAFTYSRRNSEKIILSKVCTNLNIHILFLYVLFTPGTICSVNHHPRFIYFIMVLTFFILVPHIRCKIVQKYLHVLCWYIGKQNLSAVFFSSSLPLNPLWHSKYWCSIFILYETYYPIDTVEWFKVRLDAFIYTRRKKMFRG